MNYYKISVKVNSFKQPSLFIGSALRGSFGHALKEISCINPTYKCQNCFAKERCLYYEFYEQSRGYKPFRFDIELGQSTYDFGLILFFDKTRELDISTVLEALSLMLTKYGLEKNRYRFVNSFISVDIVFPLVSYIPPDETYLYIRSLTPLILKQANRKLIKNITLEDILSSLYKRKSFFEEGKIYSKLSFTPSYDLISSQTKHHKTLRRSDIQGKKIVVEGSSVELVVKNLDIDSYKLLKYGEVVAVGNDTVRGYGKFVVEFRL